MADNNQVMTKVKRSLLWLVKPRSGVSAVKNTTADVQEEISSLSSNVLNAFKPEEPDPRFEWLAKIENHKERFRAAMEARNLTESDVIGIEKAASFKFNMWFFIAVIGLGYSIATLGSGSIFMANVPKILTFIWMLSFVAFLFTQAMRASFELYQVRSRALLPFGYWLRNPAAWLGSKAALGAIKTIAFLAGGAALAHPNVAIAQTLPSNPSASDAMSWITASMNAQDLSLQWIARLFPGGISASLAQTAGVDAGTDSFSPLFMAFNSVIMALGSGILAFHTVTGAVSTAHEGKVLGQKWHTTWAPIRICIGVASVTPISAGYCGAQLLAIQILLGGYGFANGIWGIYVNSMLSDTSAVAVMPPDVSISGSVFTGIIQAETCSDVIQMRVAQINSAGVLSRFLPPVISRSPATTPPIMPTPNPDGSYVWDYGAVCGTITLPPTQGQESVIPGNTNNIATDGASTLSNSSGSLGNTIPIAVDMTPYINAFSLSRAQALSAFIQSVRSSGIPCYAASKAVQNTSQSQVCSSNVANDSNVNSNFNNLITASQTFATSLTTAAKTLTTSANSAALSSFKTKAVNMGWASAGAFNAAIVQISSAAIELAAESSPIVSKADFSSLTKQMQNDIQVSSTQILTLINNQGNVSAISGTSTTNSTIQQISSNANGGQSSVESIISNVFGQTVGRIAAYSAQSNLSTINPMSSMMSHGNIFLTTGETIFGIFSTVYATASAADSAATGVGGQILSGGLAGAATAFIKVMTSQAGSIIVPVSMFMMVTGVVEAAILPLIPYTIWFYAVIGCAGFAVSFVVSAPLAAFMHIRMDGDELIGQGQKPFYSTLFQGAMRPTLLLFGLIASNKVFAVMAGFLNATLQVGMLSAQGAHTSGVLIMIALNLFTAYLEYQLAIHSLEMITKVPSMVSEMLGVRDIGGDEHRQGTQVHGAIVGMVNTGITSTMKPPRPKPSTTTDTAKKGLKPTGTVEGEAPAAGEGKPE